MKTKTKTNENNITNNYMSDSTTIKYNLYKIPLKNPKKVYNEKLYKLQKKPDIVPKSLLPQKELKNGFENVCFNSLEFRRPLINYENNKPVSFTYKEVESFTENTNYGLLTGHMNSLVVVDLDISKDKWNELKNNHPFIEYYNKKYNLEPNEDFTISVKNIINKINTYTIKSPNGFHIYFKSDKAEDFISTNVPSLEIDIRGSGGYIIGAYTKFRTTDNKIVEYKPYLDIQVADLTEEHNEFINIVYNSNKKSNIKKINNTKNKNNIKRETNYNLYKYKIDNKILKDIEDSLNLNDFTDTLEWLKLTAFYKRINRKEEWDIISKKIKGYNYDNNLKYWETANENYNMVEYILEKADKLHYLNYIKHKRLINNKIKPDLIVDSTGKKGLSEVININPNKNYIIKSGTATGKTYSINEYIHKDDSKIISIVSRVSLATEHYRVFSEWYDDEDLQKDDEFILYNEVGCLWNYEGDSLIIQLDSIDRISGWDFSEYIVYIDELNSVFEYLLSSSTLNSKRKTIDLLLTRIIRECKQFIGTDADISDLCLKWLNPEKHIDVLPDILEDFKAQSPNLDFEYIENTHKHYKGVVAKELFEYQDLVNMIRKEESFMVCSDSATEAHNLRNKLILEDNKYEDSTVVIDRLYDSKKEQNLDNIAQVIFSPKIIYGLDSQMRRKVFCLFKGKTISSKSMLQQIARCRNQEGVYYYFMDKRDIIKNFEFNNTNEVINKVRYCDTKINNYMKKQIEYESIQADIMGQESLYNYLMTYYLYNLDADKSNVFYHFRNGLKNIGYKLKSELKITKPIPKLEHNELFDLTKEELEKHFNENFEDEYYQRTLELIKLPIDNIEPLRQKFKDIFITPSALQEHFNYCNMYFQSSKLDSKLIEDINHKDFKINVYNSDNNKILFIKNLMKEYKCDYNTLKPRNNISKEKSEEIKKEYLQLFRFQGKGLDFTNKDKIPVILNKCIKMLVNESPYEIIKKKEGKGKERKTITAYELDLDSDIHNYHKELYMYRINKAKIMSNTIQKTLDKIKLKNTLKMLF